MFEISEQVTHADLPSPHLVQVDTQNRSHAVIVETFEFDELLFTQKPGLASVKQNTEDEGNVKSRLCLRLEIFIRERVLAQRAERLACLVSVWISTLLSSDESTCVPM